MAWVVLTSETGSYVTIKSDTRVSVSVADTSEEQIQGLSNVKFLPNDSGMLFVYEEPGNQHFWMKDMNFPIDIIWIGASKTIVDITENLAPSTYPETYSPISPAQYVLEVNAGYSQKHDIAIGDEVVFDIR